jgi:hypothetical protein
MDFRVRCVAPFGCFHMIGAMHRTLRIVEYKGAW